MLPETTTTLWIGRQDYLIHQSQPITEGASFNPPQMSDAKIQEMLEQNNEPATPEATGLSFQLRLGISRRLA
jgi:hypothetical protein